MNMSENMIIQHRVIGL